MLQNGTPVLRAIVEVRSKELWDPATFDFLRSAGLLLCLSDQFIPFESLPGGKHLFVSAQRYLHPGTSWEVYIMAGHAERANRGMERFMFIKQETASHRICPTVEADHQPVTKNVTLMIHAVVLKTKARGARGLSALLLL